MRIIVAVLLLSVLAALPSPAVACPNGKKPLEGVVTVRNNDIEIRDALLLVARKGKFNLLFDKDVRGKITVELCSVPPRLALESICLANRFVPFLFDEKTSTYIITTRLQLEKNILPYIDHTMGVRKEKFPHRRQHGTGPWHRSGWKRSLPPPPPPPMNRDDFGYSPEGDGDAWYGSGGAPY